YESVHGVGLPTVGLAALNEIKKVVHDFLKAIGRRYKDPYEKLGCELIEHAINKLDGFFQARKDDEEPTIEEATVQILSIFLEEQIKILIEDAREIDNDYST